MNAVRDRIYLPEKAALLYGICIGFITLEMLLSYLCGLKFDVAFISASTVIFCAVFIFVSRGGAGRLEKNTAGKDVSFVLRPLLILGIVFEICYAFFRALIKPIESYDAVAIYAIKAKIFYIAKFIPQDYFRHLAPVLPHPDYPLNIPLIETFSYLLMGNLNDEIVKLIFPLYFVSILVILYYGIRRFSGPSYALLFTFILATIPQFNTYATNAYADLPLSYYAFSSSLFLFFWLEDTRSTRFLLISAVMAALAAWTKNEGLMYCAINTFLIFIFNRKFRNLFIYVLTIFAILAPWFWVKSMFHLENGETRLGSLYLLTHFERIKHIIYEYQIQFFGPKKWNIIWIVFLICLAVKLRRAFSKTMAPVTLSILMALAGYTFVYMITALDIDWHLSTTASRLFLHFLPVVIYWLALILKKDIAL